MTKESLNKSEILAKILPIIEKIAEDNNLFVVETSFMQEAGKWTVKIFIYNKEKPITHEDCENTTKQVSSQLDTIITVPYRLEVSSPGTERKLKTEKEYKIFRGERVKIKLKKSTEKEVKNFYAKIKDYKEEEGLILEKLDKEEIKIKKEEISSIKLEPEYSFKSKN